MRARVRLALPWRRRLGPARALGKEMVAGKSQAGAELRRQHSMWKTLVLLIVILASSFSVPIVWAQGGGQDSYATRECRVILTLVSIEVTDDTEVGAEEWEIRNAGIVSTSNADVGDGEVAINQVVEIDTYHITMFPLRNRTIIAGVTEVDNGPDEFGWNMVKGFTLSCPDEVDAEFNVQGLEVYGSGFTVRLKYHWHVVAVTE